MEKPCGSHGSSISAEGADCAGTGSVLIAPGLFADYPEEKFQCRFLKVIRRLRPPQAGWSCSSFLVYFYD